MNIYLVYLPAFLMLFCLISNICYGETRDDVTSLKEREIMPKISEPIIRQGKGLKAMRGMQN